MPLHYLHIVSYRLLCPSAIGSDNFSRVFYERERLQVTQSQPDTRRPKNHLATRNFALCGDNIMQEPIIGRKARVKGLQSRTDLNGEVVTILKKLKNGRFSVKRCLGNDDNHNHSKAKPLIVAIKPENLEVIIDSSDVDRSEFELSSNSGNSNETVHLEVQGKDGSWTDAGPINLLLADNNIEKPSSSLSQQQQQSRKRNLPSETLELLSGSNDCYTYRHSSDGIGDENLIVFLHGAGDTHAAYDKLGKQMNLPQTATLAVSAGAEIDKRGFVELPFGLGHTWFEEMDYRFTGEALPPDHPRRISSLKRAVESMDALLFSPLTNWMSPERIFLFGFSAGACLAMETCRTWHTKGRPPLGGAICVGGGTKTQVTNNKPREQTTNHQAVTDVLITSGSNDATYPIDAAKKSKQLYYPDPSKVRVHIQKGKGHEMIASREEMQVVMQFLSKRLVRRTMMPGIFSSKCPQKLATLH